MRELWTVHFIRLECDPGLIDAENRDDDTLFFDVIGQN